MKWKQYSDRDENDIAELKWHWAVCEASRLVVQVSASGRESGCRLAV